jgi:hypothetical protein
MAFEVGGSRILGNARILSAASTASMQIRQVNQAWRKLAYLRSCLFMALFGHDRSIGEGLFLTVKRTWCQFNGSSRWVIEMRADGARDLSRKARFLKG